MQTKAIIAYLPVLEKMYEKKPLTGPSDEFKDTTRLLLISMNFVNAFGTYRVNSLHQVCMLFNVVSKLAHSKSYSCMYLLLGEPQAQAVPRLLYS